MARIRTIKPEFQKSGSMGAVSRDARLLFILLWPECDDEGRCRADPKMLAGVLFPYDDDARTKIVEWLFELEREGCIHLYEAGGHAYLQVLSWSDHQKIDHPSKSRFPAPPSKKRKKSTTKTKPSLANPREEQAKPRELSRLDLGPRTKEGTKDQVSPSPRALRAEFDEKFWPVCPRKVSRGAAFKAFAKVRKKIPLETIVDAMRRYALSRAGEDERFTKHPSTWLAAECWADVPSGTATTNGPDPPMFTPERLAELQAAEEEHRRKKAADVKQFH